MTAEEQIIHISVHDGETNIHVTVTGQENPLGYYYWGDGDREAEIAKARADAKEWGLYYDAAIVEHYR